MAVADRNETIIATQQPLEFGSFRRPENSSTVPKMTRHGERNSVIGQVGSDFAGITGTLHVLDVSGASPEDQAKIAGALDKRKALMNPCMSRVLEAGITDGFAYLVEANSGGERLSDRLAKSRRLPLWIVARMASDLAKALQAAHDSGLIIGAIGLNAVTIEPDESFRLAGFFPSVHEEPNRDVSNLAVLMIETVIGQPWNSVEHEPNHYSIAAERIRGLADGLTEPVATVLARGQLPGVPGSFSTPLDFASVFADAVTASANDIAAGAWESISRRDMAMATILMNMTAGYNPVHPDLSLLRSRLSGDSIRDPGLATASLWEAAQFERETAAATLRNQHAMSNTRLNPDAELTLLTPEIERLLAGPPIAPISRPKMNPWVLLVAGILAMILILLIAVAIAFTQLT